MTDVERALYAGGTRISWAHYTFNPWRGCVKISPACRFCYAERDTKRWGLNIWGKHADRPVTKTTWRDVRKWNREAEATGEQRRVFAASLADVFEDRDDLADTRQRLFDLIEETPWLIWMLCTKRPENIDKLAARYATRWSQPSQWPVNVWLLVTAENQRFANERIPHLIKHPVTVRGVSIGPQLGPVDLRSIPYGGDTGYLLDVLYGRYRPAGTEPTDGWGTTPFHSWMAGLHRLDWVITEGESGHARGIRPTHADWFRGVRDQVVAARVPYHHKQNGEWMWGARAHFPPQDWATHPHRHTLLAYDGARMPIGDITGPEERGRGWQWMSRVGKQAAGRVLDGRVWDEFPDVARYAPGRPG